MRLKSDRDIESYAIIGCGRKKADETRPAEDLYTSTHFRLKRRWSELYCDARSILSAEHGLVDPIERIDPYDTSIRDLEKAEVNVWATEVQNTLWYWTRRHPNGEVPDWGSWEDIDEEMLSAEFIILAGRSYLDPFGDFFEETFPFPVHYPLEGKRIGEQNSWLKERIDEHPTLEDITEDTAVAIDFGHGDADGASLYYIRHRTGNIMQVFSPDRTDWSARVMNDTPDEGVLNSPKTSIERHQSWTVPVEDVPDVDGDEWEVQPALDDFARADP